MEGISESKKSEVTMKQIGMKVLIQREKSGGFNLEVPAWIGEKFGDLLLMEFDGDRLTVVSATDFL